MEPAKLRKGQRVKLSERGLKHFLSMPGVSLRGEIIDWTKRKGTITRVSLSGIAVRWDGNQGGSDVIGAAWLEPLDEDGTE